MITYRFTDNYRYTDIYISPLFKEGIRGDLKGVGLFYWVRLNPSQPPFKKGGAVPSVNL